MNVKLKKESLFILLFFLLCFSSFSISSEAEINVNIPDIITSKIKNTTNPAELSKVAQPLDNLSTYNQHTLEKLIKQFLMNEKIEAEILKKSKPEKLVPLFLSQLNKLAMKQEGRSSLNKIFNQKRLAKSAGESGGISGTLSVEAGAALDKEVRVLAFDEYGYFAGDALASTGDGFYLISGLKGGSYYVVTWSRSYVDEIYDNVQAPLSSLESWRDATKVIVPENTIVDNIDFELRTGALVKGTIFQQDGTPLSNQWIDFTVSSASERDVLFEQVDSTSVDGQYELMVPTIGDIKISVSVGEFQQTWYPDQVSWFKAGAITVTDYTDTIMDINFTLQTDDVIVESGSISGSISIPGLFPPLLGIAAAFNVEDTSLAQIGLGLLGSYTIEDLPAGNYFIFANDIAGNLLGLSNYHGEFYPGFQSISGAEPLQVVPGTIIEDIDFTLDPGGAISGKIVNENGVPLDSLLVIAINPDLLEDSSEPMVTRINLGGAFTDTEGMYTMDGMPQGTYLVRTLSDLPDEVVAALEDILTSIGVTLDKHAGKVVDEYYGGVYNLFKVEDATRIEVVVPDETAGINFNLSQPGFFSGTIRDAVSGESVSDVILAALGAESGYPYLPLGSVEDDGTFRIGPLPLMDYKLVVLPDLEEGMYLTEFFDGETDFSNARVLNLDSSDSSGIEITLDHGGIIQGFVLSPDNTPVGTDIIDGFPVIAYDAETGMLGSYDYVQFSGGYRINNLYPGNYKVLALPGSDIYAATYYGGAADFAGSSEISLDFGQTVEAPITLDNTTGSISGHVYHAITNNPLPGVAVIAYDKSGHPVGLGMTDVELFNGGIDEPQGFYTIGGLRPGDYYIRTIALSMLVSLLDDAAGLLELTEDLDLLELIGGGLGQFAFSLALFQDLWYMDSPAALDFDLNDFLLRFSSYGLPDERDNSLLPIHVPLPFYQMVPQDAMMVSVSEGAVTTDKDFYLAPGDVDDIFVDVESPANKEAVLPTEFTVRQNYPNPFNPSTEISFSIPRVARVDVSIFDVLGRHIKTVRSGMLSAGFQRVVWQGDNEKGQLVPGGLYFAKIQMEAQSKMIKMLLIK